MFSTVLTLMRSSAKPGAGFAVAVMAAKQRLGPRRPSLVDHADLRVGLEEGNRGLDQRCGAVRTVNRRRGRFRPRPLLRQERRDVRRMVIVQVGQEHRADLLIADAGRDEGADRSVATVNQIGTPVHDDCARVLRSAQVHVRTALSAEQDELRAGRRRDGYSAGRTGAALG